MTPEQEREIENEDTRIQEEMIPVSKYRKKGSYLVGIVVVIRMAFSSIHTRVESLLKEKLKLLSRSG